MAGSFFGRSLHHAVAMSNAAEATGVPPTADAQTESVLGILRRLNPFRTAHRRVLVYVALFALGQIYLVLSGWSDNNGFNCDDGFYYFQIARNAALGHGFSF